MNSSKLHLYWDEKLTIDGSHHHWLIKESSFDSPRHKKTMKRMARRAQRRDGHKEITEQLKEDWIGLAEDLKPHRGMPNMFSLIPIWLMSEDERAGMEFLRQTSRHWAPTKGVRHWRHLRGRQVMSDCDETLYEDLKRSIHSESSQRGQDGSYFCRCGIEYYQLTDLRHHISSLVD